MNGILRDVQPRGASLGVRGRFLPWIYGMVFLLAAAGCAHYPVNQPLKKVSADSGAIGQHEDDP